MKKIDFLIEYRNNSFVDKVLLMSPQELLSNKNNLLLCINLLHNEIISIKELTWEGFFLPFKKFILSLEFLKAHIDYYDILTNGITDSDKYSSLIELNTSEILFQISQNNELKERIITIINNEKIKFKKDILNFWLNDFFSNEIEDDKRKEYQSLKLKLSNKVNLFYENLSFPEDKENIFFISKKEYEKLDGVPKLFIDIGENNATSFGKHNKGCVYIIDDNTVSLFLKIIKNRSLRKRLYRSHKKLCGSKGEMANNFVLKNIISLKQKISLLYDKKNYSELVISNYLMSTTEKVYDYLNKIEKDIEPYVNNITKEMQYLADKDGIKLESWDMLYYYNIALKRFKEQENIQDLNKDFSSYFPLEQVMNNIFNFLEKNFNLSISFISKRLVNREVLFTYIIKDLSTKRESFLEISPYQNFKKNNPFQLNKIDCQIVGIDEYIKGAIMLSFSFDGSSRKEALLTFKDICIFLHELGHALHSFFINKEDSKFGASYTSWDLIELPSQVLEELAFNYEFLYLVSSKKEKLFSKNLFNKIIESEQVEKIYTINEEIAKHKALLWLYENYKIHTKKSPQELIDNISGNKYGIYNILLDEFMVEENHLSDYAPSSYVYLFTGILANKIIDKKSSEFTNYSDLRNLYENIFNLQSISEQKLKDVLPSILNVENVDIVKYIKKNHNIKLFGEFNV